ncbi:hypothetical protein [Azospirillum sp. TSH100]|uniref:hypothetical protein n=1 Tax=Azospirillum sp. TSH100 TaxID=652764 RepID=UPI000D64F778|nr:hypothetical protein [Azospirillum sp. TSH100]QCG90021.1 hypothetical protein E6C72_19800 [Azospirillum sp. TSH100]
MAPVDSRKVEQVEPEQAVDDFVARLAGAGLSAEERTEAYEAALKHLMGHLIRQEGWLAEEFTAAARALGAY